MMRRTDIDMQRDALDELQWEPSVREQRIGVGVYEGIATLRGSVPSLAANASAAVSSS